MYSQPTTPENSIITVADIIEDLPVQPGEHLDTRKTIVLFIKLSILIVSTTVTTATIYIINSFSSN